MLREWNSSCVWRVDSSCVNLKPRYRVYRDVRGGRKYAPYGVFNNLVEAQELANRLNKDKEDITAPRRQLNEYKIKTSVAVKQFS